MEKYLTIPVVDGTDLSNARIYDGLPPATSGDGAEHICYQLSEVSAPAPMAMSASAASTAVVQVGLGKSVYELILPEGPAVLNINGTEYSFDTADVIGQTPLILGSPSVQGEIPNVTPGVVDYQPAPFLYDPAGGQPQILLHTTRDGSILDTGSQYALKDLDLIIGFDLRQEVVNGYGASSVETTLRDSAEYTTSGLQFTATQALHMADGILPVGAHNMLIAVNVTGFTRYPGHTQSIFYSNESGQMIRINLPSQSALTPNYGDINIARTDEKRLILYRPLLSPDTPVDSDDYILILAYIDATGPWNYSVCLNGQTMTSTSGTGSNNGSLLSTARPWMFGTNNAGTPLRSRTLDVRIWTDISAGPVATSLRTTQGYFTHETGAPRHPDIANTIYGQPRIWLPTTSAEANALVNLGTAGNFTSKQGVFA